MADENNNIAKKLSQAIFIVAGNNLRIISKPHK